MSSLNNTIECQMHWKDNKLATGISLAACTCKFDMIPKIQHNHYYQEDRNC